MRKHKLSRDGVMIGGCDRRTAITFALVLIASTFVLSTAVRASQADPDADGETATAPVIVEGEELFQLRGTSALPAEQRARAVADRIEALAADRSIPATELRLVETADLTRIQFGDHTVVRIADSDADFEGMPRRIVSEQYLEKIKQAITRYRQDRAPRVLTENSLYAAGAAILLAITLFLIIRISRGFEVAIENRFRSRIRGLRIQTLQLVQAEKMWLAVHRALRVARDVAMVAACLVCAHFVFSLYPWTRPLAKAGLALLFDPVRSMMGAILAAVPNLAFITVLIIFLRYILKLAHLLFSGIDHGTVTILGFDRDWAMPTYKILRMLIIAFGAVVAYPHVPGSRSDAFKGVSIFLGVMFSLGSTSAVANIIAGYMMTYRRVFKVGDRIQLMDLVGDVAEIRLQVTHLRSLKNEEITVPNSQILNSHVINYSRLAKDGGLILHTTVGIGYETPWRQVEAMLLLAAKRTPGLLREPPPFVLQKELGDFCVTYEVNVYSDRPQDSPELYTLLHRNILDVFNEYGVQIMTPAYEGDPEAAKIVPKERWFEEPAKPRESTHGA